MEWGKNVVRFLDVTFVRALLGTQTFHMLGTQICNIQPYYRALMLKMYAIHSGNYCSMILWEYTEWIRTMMMVIQKPHIC